MIGISATLLLNNNKFCCLMKFAVIRILCFFIPCGRPAFLPYRFFVQCKTRDNQVGMAPFEMFSPFLQGMCGMGSQCHLIELKERGNCLTTSITKIQQLPTFVYLMIQMFVQHQSWEQVLTVFLMMTLEVMKVLVMLMT